MWTLRLVESERNQLRVDDLYRPYVTRDRRCQPHIPAEVWNGQDFFNEVPCS